MDGVGVFFGARSPSSNSPKLDVRSPFPLQSDRILMDHRLGVGG
ncbi:hypothetical protein [Altericista sp. CCNU0014]